MLQILWSSRFPGNPLGDDPSYLRHRRQDAEERQRTSVDHYFTVDQHLELAVAPILQLHVGAEFLT